jgi:hypothetical protein
VPALPTCPQDALSSTARRSGAARRAALMVSELVLLTLMVVASIAIAGCIGGVLTARLAPRGKASKDTGPAPDGSVPRPS